MRNLKRALSLALASVMVMSMMVIGTGAASYDDFSDKDKIVNKEAVQMLVELGVINGKDIGDFDPTGIVTRAEMAKMICVVLNGGKDPSLGSTVTNSYTDTVGHWAAGYIEYCTQLGIVAGDGAGKFNPNTTVTGSEAAKMLLVALGYKSEVEGFIGANWAIGVNVRANQKGLYSDLTISVDEGLTRDSAAQMIYNALDAGVVHYDYTLVSDGSTISSSPTLIDNNSKTLLEDKFNAVKVKGVVVANEIANLAATSAKGSSLDEGKTSIAITNDDDQSTYAGTKTFSVSTGMDDLGRAVVVYVKKDSNSTKAEVLGAAITSADNKVVVDASSDPIKDVADDNDLTINGETKVAANYGNLVAYSKYTDPKTAGVEKILIDTDDDGDVDYVLMNTWYFGKVSSYTDSSKGSIAVDAGNSNKLTADDKADVVGFEDVAKGDYVLAAYIGGDLHVVTAETVTGVLEAYKGTAPTTKVTVDGTDYNVSNVAGYVGGDDDIRQVAVSAKDSVKNEATFYLDHNGYVVAMGETTANAGKYAMVLAVGSDITDQVKVALADGSVGTYNINNNGVKKNALVVGQVYGYSINSDKEIKLTNVTKAYTEKSGAGFEKGKIAIKATGEAVKYADNSTVFFYVSDDNGSIIGASSSIDSDNVSAYASYTKAPDVNSTATATVYTKTLSDGSTRVVAVVFAGKDLVSADKDDNLYIKKIINSDGDDTKVEAFINGNEELQTITVSGTDVKLRNTYTYAINSDGTYELKGNFTESSVPVTKVTGRNFVVNGSVYVINANTLVVDDSTYLDAPTATLGTDATISNGDKVIGLVANGDNEALMVVIRNLKNGENETIDPNTVINNDYTVDVFGKAGISDIMNAAVEALESMGYTDISVASTTGNTALGDHVGTLTAKNGSVTETLKIYNAARVDFGSDVLGYVHTGKSVTVTGKNSSTSLIVGTANATAKGTFNGSKEATYTFATADANTNGIVKLNEATLVTKGSNIAKLTVGDNDYTSNVYVTIGTEVIATGNDTTGANVVQVVKTSDNTFTMAADTTIAADKYAKVDVNVVTSGASNITAGGITASTDKEYVKASEKITITFTLTDDFDTNGNAVNNQSSVTNSANFSTGGEEFVSAAKALAHRTDEVTPASITSATLNITYTLTNA